MDRKKAKAKTKDKGRKYTSSIAVEDTKQYFIAL